MGNEQPAQTMKTRRDTESANRREFLRGGLRYALLAGVGTVVATVVGKQRAALPGQTCVSNGLCSGCAVAVDCGLPQALSFKQATKGSTT
jgi:hypothetical protein